MKSGLGNMPLTLFVIVAGVILYLYIRRANHGIDTHPDEGRVVPFSRAGGVPILPPVPGTPNGPRGMYQPTYPQPFSGKYSIVPIPTPSSLGSVFQ